MKSNHIKTPVSAHPVNHPGKMKLAGQKHPGGPFQKSEDILQVLTEKPIAGVYLIQDGLLKYANAKFAEILEYQKEELTNHLHIKEMICPEDWPLVAENIQKRLSGKLESIHYQFRIITKKQTIKQVEAFSASTVYETRPAVIGTLLDLTELRWMEESLKKSQERYKLLTDNMTDSMWLMNMDLKTVWISPSITRNRGYSLAEINALPLEKHLSADSLELVTQTIAEELSPKRLRRKSLTITKVLELEFLGKDGASFWSKIRFTLLRDTQGIPIGILGVGLDITEKKMAEQSLRNSEERFAKIFQISPVSICISTIDDGRYIDVNKSHLLILGYSREEMIGHTVSELNVWAKPDDRDKFIRMLKKQGYVRGAPFTMRTKTGEILDVLLSAEIITFNKEKFILSTCYDITQQKKLEEQLHQSQKMEAIGTLAGGIAHDFNNILAGIMGYTELIMTHHIPPEHPAYNFLEGTLRGIQRAKNVIAQIKTFSRRQEQKRTPLNMAPIVEEALKLLRASLPTTIRIDTHINASECFVLANATQIHQVIMNLATNSACAVKGTQGLLEVSLQPVTFAHDETVPHPDLKRETRYQELTVRDNGHGIDKQNIPRIFDPFFTTKKTGEGTGLGLSVVYGIIKSYDGVITVESQLAKGTTFRIYIPAITGGDEPGHQDKVSLRGGSERILFVDDENSLTEIFSIQLIDLGYKVTTHNDPCRALHDFRQDPAAFDLVITDMTMPIMTGIDLAQELFRIRPDIPVLLCTGITEDINYGLLQSLGIREYITKPIKMHTLASTIRTTLDII